MALIQFYSRMKIFLNFSLPFRNIVMQMWMQRMPECACATMCHWSFVLYTYKNWTFSFLVWKKIAIYWRKSIPINNVMGTVSLCKITTLKIGKTNKNKKKRFVWITPNSYSQLKTPRLLIEIQCNQSNSYAHHHFRDSTNNTANISVLHIWTGRRKAKWITTNQNWKKFMYLPN